MFSSIPKVFVSKRFNFKFLSSCVVRSLSYCSLSLALSHFSNNYSSFPQNSRFKILFFNQDPPPLRLCDGRRLQGRRLRRQGRRRGGDPGRVDGAGHRAKVHRGVRQGHRGVEPGKTLELRHFPHRWGCFGTIYFLFEMFLQLCWLKCCMQPC